MQPPGAPIIALDGSLTSGSAFYRLGSILVGPSVEDSVVAIRLANSVLFVALLFATVYLSRSVVRRATLLVFVAIGMPLAWYYIASVNPTSWLLAVAFCCWPLAYAWVTPGHPWSWRDWAAAALLVIVLVMGLSTRRDGWVVVVVSLLAAALISGGLRGSRGVLWRRWAIVVGAIFITALRIGPTMLYLSSLWTGSQAATNDGNAFVGSSPSVQETSSAQQQYSLVRDLAVLPRIFASIWGGPARGRAESALALFDIQIPLAVPALGLVTLAVLVVWSLRHTTRSRVHYLALGIVGVATLVPPLLHRFLLDGTTSIQPRYLVPATIVFLGLLFASAGGKTLSLKVTYLAVTCFALSNALSIAAVADRYTPLMGELRHWSLPETWSGSVGVRVVVVVGVLAGVVAALAVSRLLTAGFTLNTETEQPSSMNT